MTERVKSGLMRRGLELKRRCPSHGASSIVGARSHAFEVSSFPYSFPIHNFPDLLLLSIPKERIQKKSA